MGENGSNDTNEDEQQDAKIVDSETGEPIDNAEIETVEETDEEETHDVTIRVVDKETGEPIEGAEVSLYRVDEDGDESK